VQRIVLVDKSQASKAKTARFNGANPAASDVMRKFSGKLP